LSGNHANPFSSIYCPDKSRRPKPAIVAESRHPCLISSGRYDFYQGQPYASTGVIAEIILIIPITAVSNETARIFQMSNEKELIDFHILN
jgi:hypothetical protein